MTNRWTWKRVSPESGLKYKDIALLGQMMQQGADLSQPRHALYYLYLGSPEAAEAAAVDGRGAGYSCAVRDPLPHIRGSGRWYASDRTRCSTSKACAGPTTCSRGSPTGSKASSTAGRPLSRTQPAPRYPPPPRWLRLPTTLLRPHRTPPRSRGSQCTIRRITRRDRSRSSVDSTGIQAVNARRVASVRRLLADLGRSDTRGDALRKVRRRAVSVVRSRTGRTASGKAATRTSGATAVTKRPDSWYVGEWSRLAKAVFGPGALTDPPRLDPTLAPKAAKQAGRQRGQAVLAEAVARGESLERAVTRSVASLAEAKDFSDAWAIAEGAGRLPGGAAASAMGHALLLHRRRQFVRAWTRIRDLDDGALATSIPVEAVDAALADGSPEARQRALAIGVPTEIMAPDILVDLAGRFLAFGERARATELVAELRRRPSVDLDERRRYSWTLIEGWLDRRPTEVPAGSIPVAVMGYQTPDHMLTSGNLGDYIQTLALLGNLVRHSNVTFTGDDGLGELAAELQERVQPDLRAPDLKGSVHLVPVDREFSSASNVPEGTWMVAFGWHMHPLYDLRYDFPYHPNIRPLFISFHVNRLDMLTDEAQDYLRRYGPVGCRDWSTVFLLLSAGIDAFFSGCLTTTVDALFPPREKAYRGNGSRRGHRPPDQGGRPRRPQGAPLQPSIRRIPLHRP